MSRPKGSKNKKTTDIIEPVNYETQIAAAEEAVVKAKADLDTAKATLKDLKKAKSKAEAAAARRKAEEEKAKIIEAINQSGISYEDVMAFIATNSRSVETPDEEKTVAVDTPLGETTAKDAGTATE